MNAYTLKAWIKDNDSIHKEVQLLSTHTFKDLHHTLMKAFELGMIKAVCFYMCNAKWKKGQKIAFSNPTSEKGVVTMTEATLGDYIKTGALHIRYECRNGAEWLINLEVTATKKPSSSKRYPDWDDTSGISLKHLNKRAPVVAVVDESEESDDAPEEDDDDDSDDSSGGEEYGKDFDELDVPDDSGGDDDDAKMDDD